MSVDLASLTKAALIKELETQRDAVRELAAGLTDEQFWLRPLEPSNSIGHLVLHLTGNLHYFIGAKLGNTGYVRDREREFTETKPPAKETAMAGLDEAVATCRRVIDGLTGEQLVAPHAETRFGPVVGALIHLAAHFAIHRGQISYLARLVKTAR